MNSGVTVFLPTRKGSLRITKKNTRLFAGVDGGLLTIKLQQVLSSDQVDEVVLSTNDPDSILVAEKFADSRLRIIERPDELARSSTDLLDLVEYVPLVCKHDHILWTHVTSPFTSGMQYTRAIEAYFTALDQGFDSLMSVKQYRNFLWSTKKNDIVNRATSAKWPRTQDLENLYEIDSAIFLASKAIYNQERNRIGRKPYLFEQSTYQSLDVDYEEDFNLAEMLYRQMQKDGC